MGDAHDRAGAPLKPSVPPLHGLVPVVGHGTCRVQVGEVVLQAGVQAGLAALVGHGRLADHQAAVQLGRDDVRAGKTAVRVTRAAHRLAVNGAALRRLLCFCLFFLFGLRRRLAGRL